MWEVYRRHRRAMGGIWKECCRPMTMVRSRDRSHEMRSRDRSHEMRIRGAALSPIGVCISWRPGLMMTCTVMIRRFVVHDSSMRGMEDMGGM